MQPLLRYLFLGLLILQLQTVYSQSTAKKQQTVMLNHVALYVNSLEKSTAFYEKVLQLQRIPEPFKDGLHEWFSIGAHSQLHLIQGAAKSLPKDKHEHLCFSVSSLDDFIAGLEKLSINYSNFAGEPKTITPRVDGVKQIYFQDPDGYWIEINNDQP